MDRADLELLVALGAEGSLTAAAARLHTAQPALSRRLARIERDLRGVPLFERGRHGATPTAAGREVVAAAARALEAIAEVEATAARAAAGEQGVLRLGATPTLGADVLPAALAAFRRDRPQVRLELRSSGDSAGLRHAVADGALDAALAALPTRIESGLEVAWSGPQHFAVVVAADDPLALRNEAVPRRALRDRPIVALRPGEGLRLVIDALFAELGCEPTLALETADREMLVPAVVAGLGLTVVPERFAQQRGGDAVAILPLRPALQRPVGVVVRAGTADPLVAALVAAVASSEVR